MKIISLNIWGGRAGKEKLLGFFQKHAGDVDVFCLQEVWSAPYNIPEGTPVGGRNIKQEEIMTYAFQEIGGVLADYQSIFHPAFLDDYGLALYIKKDWVVVESGDVFVYKNRGYIPEGDPGDHARNVQYATLEREGTSITIMNFHGLWTTKPEGKGKQDIPERLEQSDNIVSFTQELKTPFVLIGDFNLLPTTESIQKLEDAGMKNLIREYGVTSTRTVYYDKEERFADYAFVSPELTVQEFAVLPDEVSDHSPLFVAVE